MYNTPGAGAGAAAGGGAVACTGAPIVISLAVAAAFIATGLVIGWLSRRRKA